MTLPIFSATRRDQAVFFDDALIAASWDAADALAKDAADVERSFGQDHGAALRALVGLYGERGLLSLVTSAEHGGAFETLRVSAVSLARERLGVVSPLADLAFAMQGLGSFPITYRGSDASRARWLRPVVAGDAVAAFALTEPNAGTDVAALQTRARRDGSDYILDGHKAFISNAGIADVYSLFARTERGVTGFVVPADAAGLSVRPQRVLGGHPIGEVVLSSVRVPKESILGEEGKGMGVALATLSRFRPTVGAAALGFATRALLEALAHADTREQFGAPLRAIPAVQRRLAEMSCELDAARLLVYRAARVIDEGASRPEATRVSSMAKLTATESAQRVIDSAVQLFGGRGVLEDSVVARLYQEVRGLRIYEGTSDVHYGLIARGLPSEARS